MDKVNQKKSPAGDALTGQDVYRLAEEGDAVCKEAIADFTAIWQQAFIISNTSMTLKLY